MREHAARGHVDLPQSYAYSDSITDLPMLELVGHPVAVNPDKELARVARERDWEIRDFEHPVRLRDRMPVPPAGPTIAVGGGARPPPAPGSRSGGGCAAATMPPDDIRPADVPRASGLAQLPTPLEPMDRFSEWLGGPRVLVKRDDLTGLALGGNKARKLEFLCGEASGGRLRRARHRRRGAEQPRPHDGGRRPTGSGSTATSRSAGSEPGLYSGNLLLDRVLGATLHFTGADSYYDVESAIDEVAAQLAADGRRPFAMPIGGASVTGAAAFAWAADELLAQVDEGGHGSVDWIVVADGSGGTHAGLLAGLRRRVHRVLGVDVGTRPDLDDVIPRLAVEAAGRAGAECARRRARPRPLAVR